MTDGRPLRVVLADDHPVVRAGLRALLESLPGLEVVGEAEDGAAAIRLAVLEKPDVVVLDLDMPNVDGIEASREIRKRAPEVGVLVLTMFADDERIDQALRAGATGYVVKGSAQREIAQAIAAVADKSAYFGASVTRQVLDRIARPSPQVDAFPELTGRERDVLRLLAEGLANAAIGERLGLSSKTVANHLSSTFVKLGVSTRAEAIVAARRAGM